jgi:hypothetical protein
MQVETRGRATRAEEQLPERRKRPDAATVGKRLAVRSDMLDFERFKYRYVNDNDSRLYQMVQNDWNIMTQQGGELKPDSTDMGSAIRIPVGTKPDGSPLHAYLCRKYRQFYDDDQKMKQTDLDEQLSRLRQGQDANGGSMGDYNTREGIRIART